jgi:hypothetical protein
VLGEGIAVRYECAYCERTYHTFMPVARRLRSRSLPCVCGQDASLVPQDQAKLDDSPDACWRCDARDGATDVGLCDPCHDELLEAR